MSALPVPAARPITLTAAGRQRLKKAAYGHKTPYQARARSQIVLMASRGRSNARIAAEVGVHVDTVRTWQSQADEHIVSSDEKTSIQARCRCHPTLAPGRARAMRVNHTYGRGDALAYLAAYDVHRAKVLAAARPPPASRRSWPWSNRS